MQRKRTQVEKYPFKADAIYCGDNLEVLSCFPAECVDLVYIDPSKKQVEKKEDKKQTESKQQDKLVNPKDEIPYFRATAKRENTKKEE